MADLRTDIRYQQLIVWVCLVHFTSSDSKFGFDLISNVLLVSEMYILQYEHLRLWQSLLPLRRWSSSRRGFSECFLSIIQFQKHPDLWELVSIMNLWLHSSPTIPEVCLDLIIIHATANCLRWLWLNSAVRVWSSWLNFN